MLFSLTKKLISKLCITEPLSRESTGSHDKGSIMQNVFSCHGVFMNPRDISSIIRVSSVTNDHDRISWECWTSQMTKYPHNSHRDVQIIKRYSNSKLSHSTRLSLRYMCNLSVTSSLTIYYNPVMFWEPLSHECVKQCVTMMEIVMRRGLSGEVMHLTCWMFCEKAVISITSMRNLVTSFQFVQNTGLWHLPPWILQYFPMQYKDFSFYRVNIMAAGDLGLWVTKSSAALVLTV